MSTDEKRSGDAAKFLDNLLAFLTDENRQKEEVAEDLRIEGVSPEESLRQLREMLSQYAPTWQEQAARARKLAQDAMRKQIEKTHRTRNEVVKEIQEVLDFMRNQGAAIEVGAFYRKFQEAGDEDLVSLLEDMKLQRDLFLRRDEGADADE